MAKKDPTPSTNWITYHTRLGANGKPRKNRDGSISILTLVRVPKFKRISRTFKTQEDAEAWAVPLVKELTEQGKRGARPQLSALTIGDLLTYYVDDPTVKALRGYGYYCDLANWWKLHYAPTKVLDFGVSLLHEARDKLKAGRNGRVWAPATVNRHLSLMRGAWNWGKSAGWIPLERAWPSKLLLPEPAGRTRFLNPHELQALLAAADRDRVMKTAILVSIATGLRQGELLRLKWSDIDLARGRVTIMQTKNGTPRQVHLTTAAVAALQGLRLATVVGPSNVFLAKDGGPLTKSGLEGRWKLIRAKAELQNFHWHDLRHSCASILAQNGATLLEIGSVLGHKSPSMTMRYVHLIQGAPVTGHAALDAMLRGK
jgi:integrase